MSLKICLPFVVDEIADPGSRSFSVRNKSTELTGFVVRQGQNIYAYLNQCPHTGVTLNWLEDIFLNSDKNLIQCAVHGALFSIKDGLCLWGPCLNKSLEKLELDIGAEGRIFIEI